MASQYFYGFFRQNSQACINYTYKHEDKQKAFLFTLSITYIFKVSRKLKIIIRNLRQAINTDRTGGSE